MSTETKHMVKKKTPGAEALEVPALRFEGFEGEWKKKKLGEVSNFLDGRRKPIKSEDRSKMQGEYPYYGASGIIDYVNNYIFDEELILLGEDGENIVSRNSPLAFRVSGKCWVNNHAHVIVPKAGIDIDFLTHNLERINYLIYNTGTAQPKLNQEVCRSIPSYLPSLPEQQKIASFLSAVDEKIQQLTKKKELLEHYKKGVMQQLFSGKLRFKDATSTGLSAGNGKDFPEWEEKRLSEVAERVTRKNKENNLNVLTISAQLGLVSQLEYFNKSVSAANVTNYYLLNRNDFAYNKSYSNGYPMGAIKRLKKYDKGVVSTLYICFAFNKKVSLEFMEQYFEFGRQNVELEKVAQEGARNHGLLNIGVNDFFNIGIKIPTLPEQQKIAAYLSRIDTKIESVNQQITQTQTFKKGLLQQMFV